MLNDTMLVSVKFTLSWHHVFLIMVVSWLWIVFRLFLFCTVCKRGLQPRQYIFKAHWKFATSCQSHWNPALLRQHARARAYVKHIYFTYCDLHLNSKQPSKRLDIKGDRDTGGRVLECDVQHRGQRRSAELTSCDWLHLTRAREENLRCAAQLTRRVQFALQIHTNTH